VPANWAASVAVARTSEDVDGKIPIDSSVLRDLTALDRSNVSKRSLQRIFLGLRLASQAYSDLFFAERCSGQLGEDPDLGHLPAGQPVFAVNESGVAHGGRAGR